MTRLVEWRLFQTFRNELAFVEFVDKFGSIYQFPLYSVVENSHQSPINNLNN